MADEISIGSSIMSSQDHAIYLGGTKGSENKAFLELQIGKSASEHLSNTYQTAHTQELTRVIGGQKYSNSITLPHFQTAKSKGTVISVGASYKPGDAIADNFNVGGINKVEPTEVTTGMAYNLQTGDSGFAINGGLTFSSQTPLTTKFSFEASPQGIEPVPMIGIGDIPDPANEIGKGSNPYGGTLANTRDTLRSISLSVGVNKVPDSQASATNNAPTRSDTISSKPATPEYIKTDLGLAPTVESLSTRNTPSATGSSDMANTPEL